LVSMSSIALTSSCSSAPRIWERQCWIFVLVSSRSCPSLLNSWALTSGRLPWLLVQKIKLVQSLWRAGHIRLIQLTVILLCLASSLRLLCFSCRRKGVSLAPYLPERYSACGTLHTLLSRILHFLLGQRLGLRCDLEKPRRQALLPCRLYWAKNILLEPLVVGFCDARSLGFGHFRFVTGVVGGRSCLLRGHSSRGAFVLCRLSNSGPKGREISRG